MVLRTALALNCQVPKVSVFHRKNYFYPDLPKGFQVSQYGETNPIGHHGWVEIRPKGREPKRVRIRRVHLEEDTGKLVHTPGGGSGVDFNRAGVPLMEIVTEFPPDITDAEEAREYLVQLRSVLLYLGVTDGKMEEGSLRCEPNVSIRREGSAEYGTKTELKNLNSFRSVQLGIEYEARRQAELLERGQRVVQETRGWNEATLSSYPMRSKETESDYRYFACPDLVPMTFDEETIERAKASLPELPLAKTDRYQRELGLSAYDAGVLASDVGWAEFFEAALEPGTDPKVVCNWLTGDTARMLNESGVPLRESKLTPAHLADLARMIHAGEINSKVAKEVLAEAFASGALPSETVRSRGLGQISDEGFIADAVARTLSENPEPVAQLRAGKEQVLGFLVGQVLKSTQGRANPAKVREEIKRQIL
jgi:aspartyl-tRNA(Asn)/glutamyl-tRNA(Gln) amidotransferase subunit B